MKTQTYGIGNAIHYGRLYVALRRYPSSDQRYDVLGASAIDNYVGARRNGNEEDSPAREMPRDGKYSWVTGECKPGYMRCRYDEGPGDRAWMQERDRNYVARLKREQQARYAPKPHNAPTPERQRQVHTRHRWQAKNGRQLSFEANEVLTVIHESGEWLYCKRATGHQGYVSKHYVASPASGAVKLPETAPSPPVSTHNRPPNVGMTPDACVEVSELTPLLNP